MRVLFFLVSFFLVCCQQPENKKLNYPNIIFNKDSLLLQIKPDSFSFKFIQVTKNLSKESIIFQFDDTTVSNFCFKDSIILKWSVADKDILDTLDYNIRIKIKSKDTYGFNMDFGYINKRDNVGAITVLKPLLK
jgi:hypothetical protein